MYFLIFLIGIIFGSFLSALTFRWSHEISIAKGRSFCPKCKAQINWYDNIPLFSYLALAGKCRNCKNKISPRYPLIEFSTGLIFILIFYFRQNILLNLNFINNLEFVFIFALIFIAIFVIDLEHKFIPDRLTFWGLGLVIYLLILNGNLYLNLLTGFLLALFLLAIHLITLGRGMGLGDVKLAIFVGALLGFPLGVLWMFLSFVIGSIIGIFLIIFRKVKFGLEIPFGPFLVIAFFITIIFGSDLINLMFPYL